MKSTPLLTFRNLSEIFSSVKMAIVDRSRALSSSALRLLLPLPCAALAIMPHAAEAQLYNNAHFLGEQEVSVPSPFSPFGNSLELSKFSDDGSSAITDLSGVIIWTDSDGVSRRLPDTELAVPLYVSDNEVIVWTNRYADFDNYVGRPEVQVSLYRLNTAGDVVSVPLDLNGKEILGTPQVTTSTGSLTLLTTERQEGPRLRDGANLIADFSDTLVLRAYRIAFSGAVQRIESFTDTIPFDGETFAETQIGPDAEALGYGSDGSVLVRYRATVNGLFVDPDSLDTDTDIFLWINSQGVVKPLTTVNIISLDLLFLVSGVTELTRVVSVSNERIVLEGADNTLDDDGERVVPEGDLIDYRRDGFNDLLSGPNPISIEGSLLPFPNYTKIGDNKVFFTIEDTPGTTKPKNGQTQVFYTDSFAPGSGYAPGDTITLDDGTTVTVNGTSLIAPVDAQTHLEYDGFAGNGSFVAGLDYSIGDVITLSDGSTATVDIVGVPGDVIQFTLDSTNSTGAAVSDTLTQNAVTPAGGTGFSVTLGANNVAGGQVTQFVVDSTTTTDFTTTAGETLAQAATSGAGTGFSLTVEAENLLGSSTVRTLQLVDGGASLLRSAELPPGVVSAESPVVKINPSDGAAIIRAAGQQGLVWLHDQGENFVVIPDSDQALPLYVSMTEALLWENAKAPIPEGGTPEPVLVVHEELIAGGADTNRIEINEAAFPGSRGNIEGTYVINTPFFTPSNAFWFILTAEKTDGATALLRNYLMTDTPPDLDSDSDGLPDSVETNTGTFVDANDTGTDPLNPDTDGDGLRDSWETGDGIFVSTTETGSDPNDQDSDDDGLLDFVETGSGIFVFYNFGDPTDPRNDTGTDPNVLDDLDGDSDPDGTDPDIDGDGVINEDDAFPFDSTETIDTDGDGVGNNADNDDDNDRVLDVDDAFPLDPTRSTYDLRLSVAAQTSSYFAQTREVQVSSNTTWVWVSSDPSWLNGVNEAVEQNGSQIFEYSISQNMSAEPRSAELTFTTTNGDVEITLSVTQLGGPGNEGLAVGPDTFSVGANSTVREAQVLTERDWRWESNASWITSTEAVNQSGTQTFNFTVGANDSGLPRVGTITFSTVEGDLTTTLSVSQSTLLDDDRDGLSNDEETKPYFLITGEFTWDQARLDAQRRGGTLAVITDAGELADMQDVLEAFSNNVWIGGSDTAGLGSFEWVSAEAFVYTNWAAGQPDSAFGVSGISLQSNFEWADLNKYTKLNGYILELPATNPLDPWSLDPTDRVLDGDLWRDIDNDGLLGITEISLLTDPRTADTDRDGLTDGEEYNPFEVVAGAFSWEAALEDAEDRAGRLAVIDSEEKLLRVMTAVGGSLQSELWIGGSDLMGIFNFEWITDPVTPVTYANWAEGQPNSFFGATAIKLQTNFTWDD
ncbi:MAG: BACON domain-containing protein, partial [Akkermansiaceae bacterium]